jgi:hypothetical protein
MAGSPQKRARREAEERAKNLAAGRVQVATEQQQSDGNVGGEALAGETPATVASLPAPSVPALQGDILPPAGAPEPTRTALKRAMRTRAQEHAEAAIAVLVENMGDKNLTAKDRADAANKLLEWGFGKPGMELGDAEGGLLVTIQRFMKEDE